MRTWSTTRGDAATAIPLGIAFALRSARAERGAGYAVVLAIFISARVAGYEAISCSSDRPSRRRGALGSVALAGAAGFAGNLGGRADRSRAGRGGGSPALIADGAHARADAYVSLAVVASAAVVAAGLQVADPLIGLAITIVILRITWQSWRTIRAATTGTLTAFRVEAAHHVGGVRARKRRAWPRLGSTGSPRRRSG